MRAWVTRASRGHAGEALRGTLLGFALRVLGLGLGLAFNVVLARALGVAGAGVYFLAFTFMTVASVLGRVGLDQTLMRHAAAQYHGDRRGQIGGLYRRGIAVGLLGSAATALLLFLAAPWLGGMVFRQPELVTPLRWMAVAVVPFALLNLHAELLKAVDRLVAATVVQAIGVPLLSLLLLAPAMAVRPGPAEAALIYALACGIVLLGALFLWRRAMPEPLQGGRPFETRQLLAASLPLFWIAAMQLVLTWSDNLLLGLWADSATVGGYHVAKRTALLISFFMLAVSSAVGPKFAALHAAGRHRELDQLAGRAAQLMALYAAPLLLVFLAFPRPVLGLFGPDFAAAALPLRLLASAQFLAMIAGPVGLLLIMSGHGAWLRNATMAAALLNLSLNALLIPPLGATGAALAGLGSAALLSGTVTALTWRRLGILAVPLPRRRTGRRRSAR